MRIYCTGAVNIDTPNFKNIGGAMSEIKFNYFTIKPNFPASKYHYKIFNKDNEEYIVLTHKVDSKFFDAMTSLDDFFQCFKNYSKSKNFVVMKKTSKDIFSCQ